MSYKLKLGAALAVAALALPSLAAAQDPSTRTDIVIIGAVLSSGSEVADTNAVATPEMSVVYEDEAALATVTEEADSDTSAAAAE